MRTLLLALVCAVLPASATLEPARETPAQPVILKSAYLTHPVKIGDRSYHRVSFTGPTQHGRIGRLTVDPNTCGLNEFGDVTHGTEMATRTFDVKLLQAKLADPLELRRELFLLSGKDVPKGLHLVSSKGWGSFRLIVKDGKTRRVIPLTVDAHPPGSRK